MRARLASVVAAALVLGVSPAVLPAGADLHDPEPLSFSAPIPLEAESWSGIEDLGAGDCNGWCAEPMFALGPDESIYVSAPRSLLLCCNRETSPIWRSTDGGATWSDPFHPTSPGGAWNALTGGDTAMVVDKRGTLYVSELWLGNDTMFISEDGGETWFSTPGHHMPVGDREWLVYSEPDDAIYGVYNNLVAGFSVARADLGGPLGSKQAAFFTQERSLGIGCTSNCPSPRPSGTPAHPSVDPNDGTLFVPFHTRTQGKGVVLAVSEDGGATFSYHPVPGSGMEPNPQTYHNFAVSAVDRAGNVYVAWTEEDGDGLTVFLSSTADRGKTWSGPHALSTSDRTAIFPALAAGAGGRIVLSWWGTDDAVGDPNDFGGGVVWDVRAAVSLNGSSQAPTFELGVVEEGFHRGSVWTVSKGSGDRRLLDFFDVEVEPSTGAVLVTYARDRGDDAEVVFARQATGCSLTRPGEAVTSPGEPAAGC